MYSVIRLFSPPSFGVLKQSLYFVALTFLLLDVDQDGFQIPSAGVKGMRRYTQLAVCVAQEDRSLESLLPQPLYGWDYRHVSLINSSQF